MKARILLLCEGRQDDGFHFCSGVSNVILDLETIQHTKDYKQLIEYLDRVPKLFTDDCFNNNVIVNTIYKLYEMGYLKEDFYKRIINFYNWHRQCGLLMKIEVK